MPTTLAPLTDDQRQSTVDVYSSPQGLTPLSADEAKPSLQQSGSAAVQPGSEGARSADPTIAPSLALEQRLAAEGSSTSTLSQILAWVAAAKGDFRGLTAIEDAKRRTALGKAVVPEIRRYNALVTAGKLDEANDYLNTISNSFGTRAPELVPYLTQMSAQLNTRRQQVESNLSRWQMLDESVPKDHPYRPIVDTLGRLAKSQKYIHPDDMRQALAQSAPHVQILDKQSVTTIPTTGATSVQALPQVLTVAQVDNYIGNSLAPIHGLTVSDLTNVLNGVTATPAGAAPIQPGSAQAQAIKKQYAAMLPLQARLELIKGRNIEPAAMLQAIKEVGIEDALLLNFTPEQAERIQRNMMDRITQQKIAEARGVIEGNPLAPKGAGYVTIGLTPGSSHYLREVPPTALADVQRSGGRFGSVRQEVLDKEIKPAQYGLESLDLMPALLAGNTLQTRGDVVAAGINRLVSARIGYPLTKDVEVRQAAKSILNTAIEQVENAQVAHLQGRDRADIADLKRFASGDFKTNDELLQAADYVRDRLQQIIDRAIGGLLQETQRPARSTQRSGAAQQPTTSDLEGRSVRSRQPVVDTGMKVPPALKKAVDDYERKQGLPPGSTQDYSTQSAPAQAAPAQAMPTTATPQGATPQGETDLDIIKRSMAAKKQREAEQHEAQRVVDEQRKQQAEQQRQKAAVDREAKRKQDAEAAQAARAERLRLDKEAEERAARSRAMVLERLRQGYRAGQQRQQAPPLQGLQ